MLRSLRYSVTDFANSLSEFIGMQPYELRSRTDFPWFILVLTQSLIICCYQLFSDTLTAQQNLSKTLSSLTIIILDYLDSLIGALTPTHWLSSRLNLRPDSSSDLSGDLTPGGAWILSLDLPCPAVMLAPGTPSHSPSCLPTPSIS